VQEGLLYSSGDSPHCCGKIAELQLSFLAQTCICNTYAKSLAKRALGAPVVVGKIAEGAPVVVL